ncbi:MAG: DUF6065 family protein [Maricaulaceae bacterium]
MEKIERLDIARNTLRAHIIDGVDIQPEMYIRPAQVRRDWMDEVPESYIYRCIPLLAANTMGWELLNPVESRVLWDGGMAAENLKTITRKPGQFTASSHFGSGIVTWYIPFLFRTPPELGLYVTGPANHEHNHAVPLDAFVRTDWLPFPFTLNWRVTHENTPVTFKTGEPLARIMPFPISLIDNTQLEIAQLANDPGFAADVKNFGVARKKNVETQQENAVSATTSNTLPTTEGVWNAQYVKAKSALPDNGYVPHQTVFRPKKPK